jgi:diamine N-acetyltransferase
MNMIELVEVNKENWQECINLPTSDAHRYVASNVYSIAEAQFYAKAHAYCVYANQKMVGFTMYGIDEDDETMLWIDRLMIAEPYRGQGFGFAVVRKILEEAATLGVSRVGTSTEPDNLPAKRLYEKAGFQATGMQEDGEEVYHCHLSPVAGFSDGEGGAR